MKVNYRDILPDSPDQDLYYFGSVYTIPEGGVWVYLVPGTPGQAQVAEVRDLCTYGVDTTHPINVLGGFVLLGDDYSEKVAWTCSGPPVEQIMSIVDRWLAGTEPSPEQKEILAHAALATWEYGIGALSNYYVTLGSSEIDKVEGYVRDYLGLPCNWEAQTHTAEEHVEYARSLLRNGKVRKSFQEVLSLLDTLWPEDRGEMSSRTTACVELCDAIKHMAIYSASHKPIDAELAEGALRRAKYWLAM